MKTQKLFITGGSGFIGTNLVNFYQNKGYEVRNFDIREPQIPEHRDIWQKGDINSLASYHEAASTFQPDYLIHLAARTDLLENQDLINGYKTNIVGVENTIEIARSLQSVRRVLFASSRLVCKIGHNPTSEEDYSPPNYYGLSKVIGEKLVRSSNLEKEWLIFRPTSLWGEWFDSPYILFFQSIRKGLFFKIKGHDPRKSFGYVGNSVYQIDKLMEAPQELVHKKTFYLCDYPPIQLNSWADLINKTFGKRKLLKIPKWLLIPAARIGDFLLKRGWNRVPLTSARLNNLITEMSYDTTALEEICGELPYTSEQAVDKTVIWMQTHKSRDKLKGLKMN